MKVAVASAVRTAVGRAKKGTLRDTRPDDMGAACVKAALQKVDGLPGEKVEDVVMGCAFPEGEQGFNVARNVVFLSGLPDTTCGETINRYCSSGLQAIAHGAMSIATGQASCVVAGGLESMSMVPMAGNKTALNPTLVDERPEAYIGMGYTAERVAKKFEVSRAEQDAFAARSHEKALAAIAAGKFEDEIVPVDARAYEGGKLTSIRFDTDECPRPGTTPETLAKLKPVFVKDGTVTAGNSSPMNDGAAAAVLLSDALVAEHGVKPLGYLRAFVTRGVPPDIMGIGPVPAIRGLLDLVGMKVGDIDLFEINEAFAAQAAYCQRELGIDDARINVNGGAIALGHPLGCTGAKLSATVLHELKRRGGKYGVVSMCIGGGMGAAGLFERA
jgi:acetyl-CoA acyltransferase